MSKYIKKTAYNQYSRSLTLNEVLVLVAHKTGCNPRRSGKSYIALCTAHEDRNPSLSISEGDDGKILMHCFVGCTFPDICSSLGIHARDLFPKKRGY